MVRLPGHPRWFDDRGVRQVGFALGERHGQLRARIDISKNDIRHRFGPATASIPCFQNGADLIDPGHGHGTARLDHDYRMRIGSRDLRDQIVLLFG